LFLSNQHAHLIEKALLVRDRGRVELIGFVYPPLPFFLMFPWPHPLWATTLAGLAGGATAWVLWRSLNRLPFPRLVPVLMLLAAMSIPTSLYLATQSLSEMLALLLFLIAWVNFVVFTRAGETRAGFVAGLALGVAFFVNHYAALYAVPYALVTPLFVRDRHRGAEMAAAFVLSFPVLAAIGIWLYVTWIFTGDPLRFLHDPASSLFVYTRAGTEELAIGWPLAVRATLRELLFVPLYVASGLVVALRWPGRLPAFLTPLLLITGVRAFSMVYPSHFAIGTYTVVALAALSPRLSPRWWPLFAGAALLHLIMGYATPLKGEMQVWSQVIRSGQPTLTDREEQAIGAYLAELPPRSVLLDDRIAYRIVARAGTARPFLLPADSLYPLAESQPVAFVSFVLAPTRPLGMVGGRLVSVYPNAPPPGFYRQVTWSRWQLYARNEGAMNGREPPPRPAALSESWMKMGGWRGQSLRPEPFVPPRPERDEGLRAGLRPRGPAEAAIFREGRIRPPKVPGTSRCRAPLMFFPVLTIPRVCAIL
jgi:hypothetical protein